MFGISSGIPVSTGILIPYSQNSVFPTLLQICGEGPFLFQKDSAGLHEDLNAFGVNQNSETSSSISP